MLIYVIKINLYANKFNYKESHYDKKDNFNCFNNFNNVFYPG